MQRCCRCLIFHPLHILQTLTSCVPGVLFFGMPRMYHSAYPVHMYYHCSRSCALQASLVLYFYFHVLYLISLFVCDMSTRNWSYCSRHGISNDDPATLTADLTTQNAHGRPKSIIPDPSQRFICSPLGLVPKTGGGWRRIHHLSFPPGSSVNDFIPTEWGALEQGGRHLEGSADHHNSTPSAQRLQHHHNTLRINFD